MISVHIGVFGVAAKAGIYRLSQGFVITRCMTWLWLGYTNMAAPEHRSVKLNNKHPVCRFCQLLQRKEWNIAHLAAYALTFRKNYYWSVKKNVPVYGTTFFLSIVFSKWSYLVCHGCIQHERGMNIYCYPCAYLSRLRKYHVPSLCCWAIFL